MPSLKELKADAKAYKLVGYSKMKKSALEAVLDALRTAHVAKPTVEEEKETPKAKKHPRSFLVAKAKELGIKGYSKMKKAELEALVEKSVV